MTLADLELALQWAAAEGWNPGLNDAIPFYAIEINRTFGVTTLELG